MKRELICLVFALGLCISAVAANVIPTATDEEIMKYLNGLEVPDFSATLYHMPMKMDYTFTKTALGHDAEYNVNYRGTYDTTPTTIRIKFFVDEGWITGYMTAVASYLTHPDIRFHMEGDFQLHALNSTINMEILIPYFSSNKNTLIIMDSCNATYDALIMDFNSTSFPNIEDKKAMDSWLSRSLHDTVKESYCAAIRHDFSKGTKSAAVRGILRELLRLMFGSFVMQG